MQWLFWFSLLLISIIIMIYKKLPNNDKIPILGIWTWWIWWYFSKELEKEFFFINLIKESIKIWYTLIDSAEWYLDWYSEKIVWKAIKNIDRKKLFLCSKVSQDNLNYINLINSCKKSLNRLWVSYLDLYLIHWNNDRIDIAETMKAMNYLYENWLIKNIWVSNFWVDNLIKAQSVSKAKIVVNQVEYNFINRNNWKYTKNVEKDVIPYCKENNILVMAYSPLNKWKINIKENNTWLTKELYMLKWLLEKDWIITIFKSNNISHLNDNYSILKDIKL